MKAPASFILLSDSDFRDDLRAFDIEITKRCRLIGIKSAKGKAHR